jgi:hypothetical protein
MCRSIQISLLQQIDYFGRAESALIIHDFIHVGMSITRNLSNYCSVQYLRAIRPGRDQYYPSPMLHIVHKNLNFLSVFSQLPKNTYPRYTVCYPVDGYGPETGRMPWSVKESIGGIVGRSLDILYLHVLFLNGVLVSCLSPGD